MSLLDSLLLEDYRINIWVTARTIDNGRAAALNELSRQNHFPRDNHANAHQHQQLRNNIVPPNGVFTDDLLRSAIEDSTTLGLL